MSQLAFDFRPPRRKNPFNLYRFIQKCKINTIEVLAGAGLIIWAVREDCKVDGKWMEAHCFPSTPQGVSAEKHDYLVSVQLEKPLVFDREGWAYNVVCPLNLPNEPHASSKRNTKMLRWLPDPKTTP